MLKKILIFIIFCFIIGVISAFLLYGYYSKDLPNHNQLSEYDPATVTRIYSSDGDLLEEYAKEHRIFVPISVVPKIVIAAFLSAEDKNFYSHHGIDFSSIFRAIFINLSNISKNKSLVGGSTITQQVVKNFLLTNEKSYSRKIKEAILSFKISKTLSKERILELYLNQIYLGASSYGIASASLNYFNKSIDELSIEEAALLAALPKAPSNYDPKKNYDRAIKRRNWVIKRMMEDGYITKEEAKSAINNSINLQAKSSDNIINSYSFVEEVRRDISKKYGNKALYEEGLVVRTTLDRELQELARTSMIKGLQRYEKKHGYRGPIASFKNSKNWQKKAHSLLMKMGIKIKSLKPFNLAIVNAVSNNRALIWLYGDSNSRGQYIDLQEMMWAKRNAKSAKEILKKGQLIMVNKSDGENSYELVQIPEVSGGMIVMDPYTGRVLAMVGGAFKNLDFNRSTQAKRQPGSIIKPFVYLAGLENGFTPATIVNDEPLEIYQGPGLPLWKPRNHSNDFLGPLPFRKGIEKSRNTMTINIAMKVGMEKITKMIKDFGINDNPPPFLSSVLGSIETTVMDITNAYAILINGGKEVKPSLIELIQDKNGKTIYRRDQSICKKCQILDDDTNMIPPEINDNRKQIIDPRSAYQIVSILEGTVKNGTARKAKVIGKTLGGKTSTTNNSYDGWFIGFSPELLVGIYVGFDQPKTLGKHEWGATSALPIFIDFMKEALKDRPDLPFSVPSGIKLIKIDSLTGKPPTSSSKKHNIVYESFKIGNEPNNDVVINNHKNNGTLKKDSIEEEQQLYQEDNSISDDVNGTGGLY